MCFKELCHFGFIWIAVVALAGCAKEEESSQEVPIIKLGGVSCLTQSGQKIDRYFTDGVSAAEVHEVWNCFAYALRTFQTYTRGAESSSYTAEELRLFLEKNFLTDPRQPLKPGEHIISNELLTQMMLLKRLFLGGSQEMVTRKEISETFRIMGVFQKVMLDLQPHIGLLLFKSTSKPTHDELRAAEKTLAGAVKKMTSLLNSSEARYEIANFSKLLNELRLYLGRANPDTSFGTIAKYLPAAARVKAVLLNSSSQVIEAGEWAGLGDLFVDITCIALRGFYFFESESLFDLNTFPMLHGVFTQATEVLQRSLAVRHGEPLTNQEIGLVIDEFAALGHLPFQLSVEDTKSKYEWFVDFILNPRGRNPVSGITASKIRYFSGEIEQWANIQRLLVNGHADQSPSWLEMKEILNGPWGMSLDSDGRIVLSRDAKATNLPASTRLNWMRGALNLLFAAYGSADGELPQKVLNKDEYHRALFDLQPLFIAFKLISSDETGYADAFFRDANLFMPRSDGNYELSFIELIEYLHFTLGGIDAGRVFIADLPGECQVSESVFRENCFEMNWLKSSHYLAHMPSYYAYFLSRSSVQWQDEMRSIVATVRDANSSGMTNSDIYEAFILLQYIEVLMLRFDADASGDFDIAEGLNALPHFETIIKDKLKDIVESEDAFKDIFTYMLRYGEVPISNGDPLMPIRMQNWIWQRERWQLSANRETLLKILANLKKF